MKIDAKLLKWTGEIEKRFDEINPAIQVPTLKKLVENESIYLYGVYVNDNLVGIITTRIDRHYDQGEELVIMFTFTFANKCENFTSILAPLYEKLAKGKRIRIHSDRRGHDKLLEQNGYKFLESVFIKEKVNI